MARRLEDQTTEYQIWRKTIFKRDGHICVMCQTGGRVHAHHIRPWSLFPDWRYSVENGVTLCRPCHEGLTGKELLFADRLQSYVDNRTPVELTPEEKEKALPFVTHCAHCAAALTLPSYRRKNKRSFCNVACKAAFIAAYSGDWYAATAQSRGILLPCAVCNKEMRATPGRLRQYCSAQCLGLSQRRAVTLICAACGEPFTVKQSRATRRRCCSKLCFSRYRSAQMKGKVSPRFGK